MAQEPLHPSDQSRHKEIIAVSRLNPGKGMYQPGLLHTQDIAKTVEINIVIHRESPTVGLALLVMQAMRTS